MKTIKILSIIFLLVFFKYSFSNTVIVHQSVYTFTPDTVIVSVGDTVKWMWSSLIHTTTSISIPVGAAAWSAPLDSAHTTFVYRVTVAGDYFYQCNYHYLMGMTGHIRAGTVGITPVSANVPEKFQLYQNYPNPFNPSTSIKFDLPVRAQVQLNIYNVSGELVASLVNTKLQAGTYSVDWDASGNSSGVYFYKIVTPGFISAKKLVLIK